MLVGQVQMTMRKSGTMAAFIDLKTAYETVGRGTGKIARLSGALGTERLAGSFPRGTVQRGGVGSKGW